ncbi:MAG TPA: GreA/GreB family elongation factor [Burkholderiales bacterium]|jgi:regulator of nucleoside diphosphate kinase|nr:GreA/GreB family elongation factor [Burkholderiales bacterium]
MHKPIINRSDLQLLKLLSGYSPLRRKLSAAFAVAPHNVPANVVTMNSKLTYREETDDMSKSVKLVYPAQADGVGRISVLSPLGAALLGVTIGEEIEAEIPGAGRRRIRVQDIISQPERDALTRTSGPELDQGSKHTFRASDTCSFSLGF